MSDPVRDFITGSRDAALADRTPVTLAYAALADDVLAALDREREAARDCYLAGWRAGRDAAADLCAVCMPEYVAVGEENHADAASFLECAIRALPDPSME